MIYTSYFANLKKLPKNVTPVCITVRKPSWFKGQWYGDLAPGYDILSEWKEDHDNLKYAERFGREILGRRSVLKVLTDLQLMIPEKAREKMEASVALDKNYHVALICYEAPMDFCHRHLVAEWLESCGVQCEEWNNDQSSGNE